MKKKMDQSPWSYSDTTFRENRAANKKVIVLSSGQIHSAPEFNRYFGDLQSKPTGVEFVPENLDEGSGLLPKRIHIPLSLGLLVQVTEKNNLVYYAPDDIDILDIPDIKKQLHEELNKPSPIKKAY